MNIREKIKFKDLFIVLDSIFVSGVYIFVYFIAGNYKKNDFDLLTYFLFLAFAYFVLSFNRKRHKDLKWYWSVVEIACTCGCIYLIYYFIGILNITDITLVPILHR